MVLEYDQKVAHKDMCKLMRKTRLDKKYEKPNKAVDNSMQKKVEKQQISAKSQINFLTNEVHEKRWERGRCMKSEDRK